MHARAGCVTLPAMLEQPRLRPGARVVRRDAGHLQVGLDPPHRAVIADDPAVHRLLTDLRCGRSPQPSSAAAWSALHSLQRADLLVEAAVVSSPGGEVAAAQFGPDAARRLAARAAASIGVLAPRAWRGAALRQLADAGLSTAGASPVAWLLLARGPLRREELDAFMRDSQPHLVVEASFGSVRAGPFVVPGRSACLRCVDAHQAERDPRRSLVLEQVAAAAAAEQDDPVDPASLTLALAWVARDLARYVEGELPSTWSASFDIGPQQPPVRRDWRRHPHCGCAWDGLVSR